MVLLVILVGAFRVIMGVSSITKRLRGTTPDTAVNLGNLVAEHGIGIHKTIIGLSFGLDILMGAIFYLGTAAVVPPLLSNIGWVAIILALYLGARNLIQYKTTFVDYDKTLTFFRNKAYDNEHKTKRFYFDLLHSTVAAALDASIVIALFQLI